MINPSKITIPDKNTPKIDIIFAILLLFATLSSAFCVYEATRWSGIQAEEFGNSAKFRTESVSAANQGNVEVAVDVQVFTSWVNAITNNNIKQADFLKERFRKEFKPAFNTWISQINQSDGSFIPPGTPFDMPEYQPANYKKSKELESSATDAFDRAKDANENGDQYILITVLFAIVLFFCGIYSKWETSKVQFALLAVTLIVFSMAFFSLISLLLRLGIV